MKLHTKLTYLSHRDKIYLAMRKKEEYYQQPQQQPKEQVDFVICIRVPSVEI